MTAFCLICRVRENNKYANTTPDARVTDKAVINKKGFRISWFDAHIKILNQYWFPVNQSTKFIAYDDRSS